MVVPCGLEGGNEFSRDFLDEPPHFEALESVSGDKLCASREGFGEVPRDEVALCEGLFTVDDNGNLSICIGIMSERIRIGLFEPGLLVITQSGFFEGEGDVLFEEDEPGSLGEGADAVGDEGNGLRHGYVCSVIFQVGLSRNQLEILLFLMLFQCNRNYYSYFS